MEIDTHKTNKSVTSRWFHGPITRHEAEIRLAVGQEGSYLVRLCESNRDEYALSVR